MAKIVTAVAIAVSAATSSVAAAATLLDSGASVLGNCHDLLYPNFLVEDEAELVVPVDLVPDPVDLDLAAIASTCFAVVAAIPDGFGGSPDRIDLDSRHSRFLVDERAGLVAPVVVDLVLAAPDLVVVMIEPIDFVVIAAMPVDFGESLGCIDRYSMSPNFLVDESVGFLDFREPVATYLAEAVAGPCHFAVSAVDIDCDLGCSSPTVDDVVALLPFLAVAERRVCSKQ